ncbi:hypothetical protein I79_016522 [Cricetulus griseus]|uniref:Uncharacterized protein n=1 Tax=Cricetulus griseus TaxID=10029 RepID=G3HZL5_CRIGR|nr:hypothetical protein I79_016522 [Cricetulus griseus]
MVHHSVFPVPATAYCVNHLQIQTRSTATLPPAGGRDMCAREWAAWVRGRAEAKVLTNLPQKGSGEKSLRKGKGPHGLTTGW